MGAETDLSPPLPEPTLSPEPDIRGHDSGLARLWMQDWKADMMSALGESVSFGRFLSEPLEWGKWSAFAHNRYLEEAARQARPGSVAQKKAMFEAHYARKRKMEADAAAAGAEGGYGEDLAVEDGGEAASVSSSVAGSSCMTDETAAEQEVSGGGGGDLDGAVECGGGAGDGIAGVATEEVQAVTDSVGSACKMDEPASEIRNRESDVSQSPKKQDSCNSRLVSVDAVEERQPLKERSIVNQDVTDSAKKRRLQMPSLFQKPAKLSSPSSGMGKKGQSSSSAKRRSALRSSKENASPPSTDSSKRSATSVPKTKSTLAAPHMSVSFSRCETGKAASSSRNLGTTIAERISQLQSASRSVENTPPKLRPPKKSIARKCTKDVSSGRTKIIRCDESQTKVTWFGITISDSKIRE
ncbi:hypothetical protein PR202_ga03568 [Eleusine coracana subsp. coracana]|uniref:Uncharacterized protein n=1 Tax=Eleusine coracana subsp. coracana TaxID=191504 RepID=A0AAV5BMF7_ELECO|nr:hypothetical protein PR202_ga03568 [Eleusine coracana subsp. coracana]